VTIRVPPEVGFCAWAAPAQNPQKPNASAISTDPKQMEVLLFIKPSLNE
jgi:hypothetical protein